MALGDEFKLLACVDEDGNIVDKTDNHTITNNGVTVGAVGSGPFNNSRALVADSTSDALEIPYSQDWSLPAQFTIDFWMKLNSITDVLFLLIGTNFISSSSRTPGWFAAFDFRTAYHTEPHILFDHAISYGNWGTVFEPVINVSVDNWYHVAIIRKLHATIENRYDISIFLDGNSVAIHEDSSEFTSGNQTLSLLGGGGFGMNGSMAEIAIRNIAVDSSKFPPTRPYWITGKKGGIDKFDNPGLII